MTVSEKIAMMDSGNPGVGRLGIRPFQFGEGLHGVDSNCGVAVGEPDEFGVRTGCPTSYPSGIAEGATFNKSLWLTVGAADGREGRALHNQADGTPAGQAPAGALSGHGLAAIAFWAPDMNLFRDPRWGRGQEVPGEDPVLTSEYVKHFSQGLMYGDTQHGDVDPNHLQILSTCKHFAGYDIETGRSSNDVSISPRMLTEYYLPVFKTCIQVAKVKSMMCSYNAVNGVPSCANGKFQNELVREQWGWDGFIVSDCGAIGNIQTQHHYAATAEDAVADAVRGGTDLECDSFYKEYLQSTIAKGKLAVSDLDTAVSRILTHFVSLGELEGPEDVVYQNYGPEMVDTTEHRRLALSVAEQAMTLLKNDPPTGSSEPLLPLNRHQSIALIGPQANFTLEMLSNYEGQNTLVLNHSTLMVAMRQGLNVTYAVGHSLDVSNTSTALIPEAVAAAKAAEVAVVMVGLCADHCTGNGRTENEGNDRGPNGTGWKDLGLPGAQQQLLEAVVAAQPRTVLVMQNGGMLSISWAKERVPAILEAYYPGELGGDAIVRTLLGSNNPGGKTPVTWYPSTILQRDMHDMDITSGQGLTHLYYKGEVLWPFGHGLSYTTFQYTWTSAVQEHAVFAAQDLGALRTASVGYECSVRNTGKIAGDAVVLGFINSTDPQFPRQKLFDFERVSLRPGEEKTVLLTMTANHLGSVDVAGNRWLRPALVGVQVGDVLAPATASLRVEAPPEGLLLEMYALA